MTARFLLPWIFILSAIWVAPGRVIGFHQNTPATIQSSADSCKTKLDRLIAFAGEAGSAKRQQTRFTAEEVNSYLAQEISPQYHPSLKSVTFEFDDAKLRAVAMVDFDQLKLNSTQFVTQLLAAMFTGSHQLSVSGTLIAEKGMAWFKLEEARFDDTSLPKVLVEEIISAVGRRQNPPFDPIEPSTLPYSVQRVEVRPGYIVVYQ